MDTIEIVNAPDPAPPEKEDETETPLRFNQRDEEIFDLLNEFAFITAEMIAKRTGRNFRSTNHRLKRLFEGGILDRQETFEGRFFAGYAYRIAPAGVVIANRKAKRENLKPITRAQSTIDHEIELTRYKQALFDQAAAAGMEVVFWTQDKKEILDRIEVKHPKRKGKKERLPINADAFFGIAPIGGNPRYYYLEIERQRRSHVRNNEGAAEKKVRTYFPYRETDAYKKHWAQIGLQVEGFRVVFTWRTPRRVNNFLERIQRTHPYFMFWSAWDQDCFTRMFEEIFLTPKDFNPAEPEASPRHSLVE